MIVLMGTRPSSTTLFPYTTLFRSVVRRPHVEDPPADPLDDLVVEPEDRGHRAGVAARGNPGSMAAILGIDRKSTRLNSSNLGISYAVFLLQKKIKHHYIRPDIHEC